MKRYFIIGLHYIFFFCLLYKIKKATFPYYDKISTFISLELIGLFIFFNLISSTSELSGLELHILHILLAYIIVSYLYVSLLKKNESKRMEK